jgi:uncharacterized protein
VSLQLTTIMLGVQDLARAKKFYVDLGAEIAQDYPNFVNLNVGGTSLALYEWEAAAQDAGVDPKGDGFRGVSFHYIVDSTEAVDAVMTEATDAGGAVVRKAEASQWAGYYGYFSDPDGYLWKVAANT